MYFGTRFIEPENTSYDPYYEEKFYNEFYNIFWAANNELDFELRLSSLMEAGNELMVPGTAKEKSGTSLSIADRINKMIDAIINWIKDAFNAVIKAVHDAYEKVKNNTVRDQALQKLFKNFNYDKIEEARELGWQGIPKNVSIPISCNVKECSIVYTRFNKYFGDTFKDVDDLLDKMYQTQTFDNCRECYNEIMDKINDLKGRVTLKNDPLEPKVLVYSSQATQYGSDPNSSKYIPMKPHFEGLEDIVFHSQQKLIDIKKSFEENFKKACLENISKDKNELKNIRRDKGNDDSEGKQCATLMVKARLAATSYKLSLAKEILKDGIQNIKESFIFAVSVYSVIFFRCTGFLKKHRKDNAKGKEPEPEATAASFIDFDTELDLILDM